MNLATARTYAAEALQSLAPFCERAEIAGSIRRLKPEVKDIEIVCVPRSRDLGRFVEVVRRWPKIKGEPTGKYTQRLLPCGMKLDLFMCSHETWPVNFVIRTGSAEFSHALAVHAQKRGYRFRDARLETTGGIAQAHIREEGEVFTVLGLRWMPPCNRIDASSLREVR